MGILFRTLWQWFQVGGLISFGHWLGNDKDEDGNPGLLSGLSGIVKWLVIGGVVYVVYSFLGKKIKIGK